MVSIVTDIRISRHSRHGPDTTRDQPLGASSWQLFALNEESHIQCKCNTELHRIW